MTKKTLILMACAAFLLGALPASTASAQSTTALSASDEKFLTEMPIKTFPDAKYMEDKDGDGIADGEDKDVKKIPSPFEGEKGTATADASVKYVYKGNSQTTLRRSIIDDRVDDGYVQGLMQQSGPK